ncbi:MAG: hypothetical protein ACYT04_48390 [Nostoc sp.]
MKFYSALLAIALIAGSIVPSLASSPKNPSEKTSATEQVNPPINSKPFRGRGRG